MAIDRAEIINDMEFRAFISVLFIKNNSQYKRLSNKLKEKYFYQVCSMVAKHDPLWINSVQSFQHWSVLDAIRDRYAGVRVPSWIYKKSAKSSKAKELLANYTKEEISYVLTTTQYEYRSLLTLADKDKTKTKELLSNARKVIKGSTK